jgi:hypothetical protein
MYARDDILSAHRATITGFSNYLYAHDTLASSLTPSWTQLSNSLTLIQPSQACDIIEASETEPTFNIWLPALLAGGQFTTWKYYRAAVS